VTGAAVDTVNVHSKQDESQTKHLKIISVFSISAFPRNTALLFLTVRQEKSQYITSGLKIVE